MAKRILVGVDFSEASRKALERGASLAIQFGSPLIGMHVLEPPAPVFSSVAMPLVDPAWTQAVEADAWKQLGEWLAPFALQLSAYAGAEPRVCWGRPAERLAAEAGPETLLVLGNRGHSKVQRLLFGSTVSSVAHHARGDLLIVRAGGPE